MAQTLTTPPSLASAVRQSTPSPSFSVFAPQTSVYQGREELVNPDSQVDADQPDDDDGQSDESIPDQGESIQDILAEFEALEVQRLDRVVLNAGSDYPRSWRKFGFNMYLNSGEEDPEFGALMGSLMAEPHANLLDSQPEFGAEESEWTDMGIEEFVRLDQEQAGLPRSDLGLKDDSPIIWQFPQSTSEATEFETENTDPVSTLADLIAASRGRVSSFRSKKQSMPTGTSTGRSSRTHSAASFTAPSLDDFFARQGGTERPKGTRPSSQRGSTRAAQLRGLGEMAGSPHSKSRTPKRPSTAPTQYPESTER